jgi:uncharacterized protein (DUF58 family)
MTGRAGRFVILLLLIVSILLRNPLLLLLDILLMLVAGASALWGRYCLSGVSYARRFDTQRLFCGETLELWIEIVNAKPLPLAWLKAEDEFPLDFAVERVELGTSSKPHRRTLTNLLSLRWYERVRRRYRLTAEQRGAFEFGPVALSSGDIFGFRMRTLDLPDRQTVLVYPRVVPVEGLGLRAARPGGELAAPRRVIEDPLRLAGVRDYVPGDSVRHIHWKGTARRGTLQTRVFEPAAAQHLVVFLNGQTLERAFEGILTDLFETAIVVAASLAQAGLEARHPVGLFTNNSVREAARRVRLPASRHSDQMARILETLAQMTHFTQMPFDHLLRVEAPLLAFGSTVIAVSALVNDEILAALLALHDTGHPVALVVVADPEAAAPALNHVPEQFPVYVVRENWFALDTLELD